MLEVILVSDFWHASSLNTIQKLMQTTEDKTKQAIVRTKQAIEDKTSNWRQNKELRTKQAIEDKTNNLRTRQAIEDNTSSWGQHKQLRTKQTLAWAEIRGYPPLTYLLLVHMDPGLQRGHWPFVMGWLSLAQINSLEKESVQHAEQDRTRKRVSKGGIFDFLRQRLTV